MSGSGGGEKPYRPPPAGARVAVAGSAGKWAAATVAEPDGVAAPHQRGLPHCLRHDDDQLEWVRFVGHGVVVRPPKAQAKGKRGQAAAGGGKGAAEACAYVVLPEGVTSLKGRPSQAMAEAKRAAVDAVRQYQQQQGDDGGDGASASSPAKRPRLAGPPAGPVAAAAAGEERQQKTAAGVAAAVSPRPTKRRSRGSSNGLVSPAASKPAAAAVQRRQSSQALDEDEEEVLLVAATAGEQQLEQQQQQQQQQQQEEQHQLEQQVRASAPPAHAADAAAATADGQQRQEQPAAAPAAPTSAAAAVLPKRPAVTELGGGGFPTLATVPVDEDEDEAEDRSQRQQQQQQERRRLADPRSCSAERQQHERPRSHAAEQAPPGGQLSGAAGAAGSRPCSAQQQRWDDGEPTQQAAEPPSEQPGDVACRQFAALLPGLTAFKESITAAAAAAIKAGQLGACKEVVRCVLQHMEQQATVDRRVPYFYLLDAVLAHSRKEVEGCGPTSLVGTLFPRTVAAALSQLVELLGAGLEPAKKMERTLANTWSAAGKRGVEASLVQRALQGLRERIAQHEAAWGDPADAAVLLSTAAPAAAGPGAAAAKPGASGRAGAAAGGGVALDEAGLWRMLRKIPMRNAPLFTFVNLKTGKKVRLTHAWRPDAWPDYDALPLPPGAYREQYTYRVTLAAQQQQQQGVAAGETHSPWHDSYSAAFWSAQGFAPELQLLPPRGAGTAAAGSAMAAQQLAAAQARLAAAQAQQFALWQQQLRARAQSTAAAAMADEFDAGLFKEAAGGVAASAANQQLAALPDLLQPLGAASWGPAPPLPNQPPPLPEDGWPGGEEEEEEEDFGPPPLPPHSPPRDEYEMETEGDTPPPLPPSDDEDALPPLPPEPAQQQQEQQGAAAAAAGASAPGGQEAAAAAAAPGYQQGWSGYTPPVVPPGFGVQTAAPAAYHAQPGWPGGLPAMPAHLPQPPLYPPGMGIAANPAAALAQQQRQQAWMAQQQQQQQAFMMQQQQQQQAAMMAAGRGVVSPAIMAGQGQQQQQQMLYTPGMTPTNPVLAQQQAAAMGTPQQLAFTPGQPPRPAPPILPRPG